MILKPIVPIVWIIVAAILLLAFAIFCIIRKSMRRGYIFRRIAIIALVLCAFLRPMVGSESIERIVSDLNVFFVVDNSGSMATKDMDGGKQYRYEVMKNDIKKSMTLLPGARYGMTVIDYAPYQALPLTNDTSMANAAVDALRPRKSSATIGTDLESLLEKANGIIAKYNERNPDRRNIIFLLTDGEESTGKNTELPEKLASNIYGGAVIGYGSDKGDIVHQITNEGAITDDCVRESVIDGGNCHISAINETNLKAIADDLGMRYIRRSENTELPRNLDQYFWENARSAEDTSNKMDTYWIISIAMIALLLWDATVVAHKLVLERKAVK